MRLLLSCKILSIGLLVLLVLPLVLIACDDDETSVEEQDLVVPVNLIVEPTSSMVGETVTIAASGLQSDSTIEVKIDMSSNSVPVGVTYSLKPIPEVNEFGAFSSLLSLKGYTAGVYTVQLIVDEELAATAPLEITQ